MLPGVEMGADNTSLVLYRHVETGEVHHLGPFLHVELVEAGLPELSAARVARVPSKELQRLHLAMSKEAPGQLLRNDHADCSVPRRLYLGSPEEMDYWLFHSQLRMKIRNLFTILFNLTASNGVKEEKKRLVLCHVLMAPRNYI